MPHYYDTPTDKFRPTEISFRSRGREFTIKAGSGVFSKHSFDNATALMLEKCSLTKEEKVLDLGCGWGPVGLVLKTCFPSIELVMVDTNPRAVMLARENLNKYHCEARIFVSEGYSKFDDMFTTILLNPPMAAGRETCFELIEESYKHLEEKGSFYLVARYQKGGKMLENKIEEVFGNVETVGKSGGFRVFKAIKAQ